MKTEQEPTNDAERISIWQDQIIVDADDLEDLRLMANEDTRFVNVPGGMWEGEFGDLQTDRVKLELDLISDALQTYIGEWRENRTGVEFKPGDDKTTDDDAELLNGIYRADFRTFNGKPATDYAVDETATCGFGCFMLAEEFEDEGDPENENKDIVWRTVTEAYRTVYFDRAATTMNKRDARHVTRLKAYTVESRNDAWPDAKDKNPSSAYEPERLDRDKTTSNPKEVIYVATRYEVVKKKTNVYRYNNLATEQVERYFEEEHTDIESVLRADPMRKFVGKRKITRRTIEKTVFDGSEILEPTRRITGEWLPLIPMYGFRSYVDNQEWWRGLVRKLKDAARLNNTVVSQIGENAASNGQDVPLFDPDQMSGTVGHEWQDKNNKSWLPVRALRDNEGNIVHQGPLGYLKPSQLDGSTIALMQIIPDFIRNATGGLPQDTLDPDASGKAINAMITRVNMQTYVMTDNIKQAIEWSGTVYESKARENYNSQRIKMTLGKDGATFGQAELFKTTLDPVSGLPVETNKLDGKYGAYADTGPQYDTLREQTVEELVKTVELLSNVPGGEQYIPAMVGVILDNITGVGLEPVKELNRKIMLTSGMVKPETEEEEALVQQSQQQQEPSAQDKALEGMAEEAQANARKSDSETIKNFATAKKTEAETVETQVDTAISVSENEQAIEKQNFEKLEKIFTADDTFPQAQAGLS